jgi:hypothetical protein
MNTEKATLIASVIRTSAPSACRSLSGSPASASTRAPAEEMPNSKSRLVTTMMLRQKANRPISPGSIHLASMMLAKNPANIEAVCAEKSMPVWRVVSPSLKREPDVGARTSDADGRVSAASVIAPLNHSETVRAALRGRPLLAGALAVFTTKGRPRRAADTTAPIATISQLPV